MITIEQQGTIWIASDGTNHAEGEDTLDAVAALECIRNGLERNEVPMAEVLERCCLKVMKLAYFKAPMVIIRAAVDGLNREVRHYESLAE